jgi:Na+-driven multidrug efflux pump
MFILMPGFGLVQGLAPIAGFNFGAKLWQRLVDVTLFSTKILFVYFIVGFLLIQFGSTFIFSIFSEETNQDFIEIGSRIFRIIGIGFIFISFQVIASSIYQAFGYAKRALFISLSRQFIFFIPLLFVFTFYFELDGVWYTFFVADILSGIVSLFMLIYEVRVLRHNAKQEISA